MKNKWLILSLLLSLAAGWALLTTRHFRTHDDIQVFRLNEYLSCWQSWQFPCRWSMDLGKGYGYPYFIFYPPAIYVIPALIHVLSGQSLIFSLNLAAYLTFPLAAYAMYRLVKTLTQRDDLAAVASIIYTFAPYHAVNIFVRGVYAENLAWAFAPLLFAWVYEHIKDRRGWFKLTLGITALFLTHNISAMLVIPLLIVWAIVTKLRQSKKGSLVGFGLSLLTAVGLSAWFLLPALLEKSLVQTESMISGYYAYLNHFVSLSQVFISNFWGYGASMYETQYDGMSFAIGYPVTLGLLIVAIVSFRSRKFLFFAAFTLLALFMTHAKSLFLWSHLPLLPYIQFPWRFLGIATTLAVAGIGYGLSFFSGKKARVLGLILAAATIGVYGLRFRPEKYDTATDGDFITGVQRYNQQVDHIYDYLPKTVKSIPDSPASSPIFSGEGVEILQQVKTSRSLSLELDNPRPQTIILSQFDYPGWQVKLDGQPISHSSDVHGLITAAIPAGQHFLDLSFHETKLRIVSDLISVITLVLLMINLISRRTGKQTR